MVHLYHVPSWFLGYDIILHIIYGLITLLVSIAAFRVFRISQQRSLRLFATSFFFISAAYFFDALLNLLIVSKLNESIGIMTKIFTMNMLSATGSYLHIFFFTLGLATLAYMTFKSKNLKTYSLTLLLCLLALSVASNLIFSYHLLSSILLIYIVIHYSSVFISKKKYNALLMLIAFAFLLIGSVHFVFSALNNEANYVISHAIELVAYLLILVNLVLVRKNEQKKK